MCSTEFCRQLLLKAKLSVDREFPIFDCRAFNIPEFEVVSYFWDRSADCVRNSIQNLARTKFSDKQLHGKNSSEMQEMLFADHGINWAELPQEQKAGVYCRKVERQEKVSRTELALVSTHFKGPMKAFVTRTSWELEPVPASKTCLREAIQGCCKTAIEREPLISFTGTEIE